MRVGEIVRRIRADRIAILLDLNGYTTHSREPELVTSSDADYESLARRLAHDRSELGTLRARLATNRIARPLFDMARYTRDLEESLRQIWADRPTPGTELVGQ